MEEVLVLTDSTLWEQVVSACQRGLSTIFVGDLQQAGNDAVFSACDLSNAVSSTVFENCMAAGQDNARACLQAGNEVQK